MNKILTNLIKYKGVLSIAFIVLFGLAVAPAPALGQAPQNPFGIGRVEEELGGTLGTNDLIDTITGVIKIGLSLLGIIAVVIILAGGFKWMTAGGNEDKVGEAKKMIISGVIGLAIIMSAFAIAQFVIKSLAKETGAGAGADDVPAGL